MISCFFATSYSQTKILFDASKAEAAGNADWVIDADVHNIGYFNGPAQIGGTESNAQKIPTPLQATITTSTVETYWNGGISNWGIDCVKKGYQVESLPYNGSITYGLSSNTQDLSNYKVFVVCEPNILFTSAQKTAILQFVQNGGGLFMVCDHGNSDRNGDGYDSQMIWNDFMTNNNVQANPFGFSFDSLDFSQTSNNIASIATDTILHGPYGNVTSIDFNGGTAMTLYPSVNPNVKGVIYKSGSSTTGNSNALMARSRYGLGKVAAIGDSSPADDGTGDSNDVLYDGYITGANGNNRKAIMNATYWLATNSSVTGINDNDATSFNIFPNPAQEEITIIPFNEIKSGTFTLVNILGEEIISENLNGQDRISVNVSSFSNGIYFASILSEGYKSSQKIIVAH
jgi:hypothetical protein